ncbi:radical SAM protein [Haladaptatus halobius]|uniref:radical SAM protein n=1 Tax=Haladaptatus halobius TaxID=2884875 RepID=UPI001D09E538|nr:radical SAM protein [Haladaptatus halobius]
MLKEQAGVNDAQREWGNYVLYRDNLPERLSNHLDRKQKWKQTRRGCGVVGISFSTDCYMDGRAGAITRDAVQTLTENEKYTRVLSRNPILALQDHDVFQEAGEYVTIGSSIPCLHSESVAAIEPRAPSPEHRLRGLIEFDDLGVQTYVSMSPTYPTLDKDDLRMQLKQIAACNPAVVFHEPINPRGANFEMTVDAAREAGQEKLAQELSKLQNRERWAEYAMKHLRWVQELGEELDLPVHLWPDKNLRNYVSPDEAKWIEKWRHRQSPEPFGERELPSTKPPKLERHSVTAD